VLRGDWDIRCHIPVAFITFIVRTIEDYDDSGAQGILCLRGNVSLRSLKVYDSALPG
jgi:hypothetical protein